MLAPRIGVLACIAVIAAGCRDGARSSDGDASDGAEATSDDASDAGTIGDADDGVDDGGDATSADSTDTGDDPPDANAIPPVVIAEDGGWCWFQDERALFVGSSVVVSSLSREGDVEITAYDVDSGERSSSILARLERDDHDVASLVQRSDGRLVAFYTNHTHDPYMRWRISEGTDADVTAWTPEQTFDTGGGVCYSNPYELADEPDAPIYNFYRSLSISPTFSVSRDGGDSWAPSTRIIYSDDGVRIHRPYVKYASNGRDTVHLVYTDGHPTEWNGTDAAPLNNNLYHLWYRGGDLHRTDGTVVDALAPGANLDLPPAAGTLLYDGNAGNGEAWSHDVEIDADGNPVVVYAVFPDQTDEHTAMGDHRYRMARWDGTSWHDALVAYAGRGLTLRSRLYSAGISIDPDDTDVVYFSSNVDPETSDATDSGRYEIYRARTTDGGESWAIEAITHDSVVENLRPIVPAGHPTPTAVLWLQGSYDAFIDYNTRVVGLFGPADATAEEAKADEPLVPIARFDVEASGDATAPGFVAAAVEGSSVDASDGDVRLELANVGGAVSRERGGALYADFAFNDRLGDNADDKLRVRLSGLAPHTEYVVRLHQYDAEYHPLVESYWFHDPGAQLAVRGQPAFVGGHRLGHLTSGAGSALDVRLAADDGGAIELVARSLVDHPDAFVALAGVEVFARQQSELVASFDVQPSGGATAADATALEPDCAADGSGSASSGGITVSIATDRGDCARAREGEPSALVRDFVFADEEITATIEGLVEGELYEVTLWSTDTEFGVQHASSWWVEEAGAQPVVVRAFHYNGASSGPSASFSFHHRARASAIVLRGHDLVYEDKDGVLVDSVVPINGLEVRRVQ